MSVSARLVAAFVLVLIAHSAGAQNRVPSERALETLVKTSLLSFNDANITGNYTVFHAKLSKPFREQFSPDRLKESFKEFSDKHIDIDVVAASRPTYTAPPAIDGDGKLVVKGFFPTEQPVRVNFELDFIPSDAEWKLIRIHVKLGAPP
jgi:hypothetical protein